MAQRRIGVLALQGDFHEHAAKFEALGATTIQVRRRHQLDEIDALVLPGGESTTIAILESAEAGFSETGGGIFDAIISKGQASMPIWGTCMGSILLAKDIEGSHQGRLALMDITIRRNAFGPQRFSSESAINIPTLGKAPFPGIFIRAPLITAAGSEVEVLARTPVGIVMVRQANYLATVFHPEITNDLRVHEYFLSML